MRRRPIEERFAEKYVINVETGCWEWTGAKIPGGYGQIGRYRGGLVPAHRLSYELHCGRVPKGKLVLHRCHNASCVNPEHLYLGTHKRNMADLAEAGRRLGRNAGSTLSARQLRRMAALLSSGHTQRAVADKLGIDRTTVQRTLYRGDLGALRTSKRVFLTEEQRAEAIRMLKKGNPVMTVAQHFGVDRKTIRNLRPKNVPQPPIGRPRKKGN